MADSLNPPPPIANQAGSSGVSSLPPEAIALAGRFFEAARNGQMDIFQQALRRGLGANLTNDKGDSLIMLAAYHGHAPLVRLLLAHGADPNCLNDRGQSPLAGVVFKNEAEVIRVLLSGGADPRLGTPSACEACVVFKQVEYAAMFEEQIRKLDAERERAGAAAEAEVGSGNGG